MSLTTSQIAHLFMYAINGAQMELESQPEWTRLTDDQAKADPLAFSKAMVNNNRLAEAHPIYKLKAEWVDSLKNGGAQ